MLEISLNDTKNLGKIASMIKHGAIMMKHLVKSLLDRSLLVKKLLEPSYSKINVQAVVQEIIDIMSFVSSSKNIKIEFLA